MSKIRLFLFLNYCEKENFLCCIYESEIVFYLFLKFRFKLQDHKSCSKTVFGVKIYEIFGGKFRQKIFKWEVEEKEKKEISERLLS